MCMCKFKVPWRKSCNYLLATGWEKNDSMVAMGFISSEKNYSLDVVELCLIAKKTLMSFFEAS